MSIIPTSNAIVVSSMNNGANNKSDSNLLKRSAYTLADSTASSIPLLAQAWALCKALYGNALELRQQRALEWVEAISNDSSAFNEDLINSEEFQDGFVVALEDYIKIRDHIKRSVARKVFKEFAISDKKIDFQLERYNDTLQKISPSSISLLGFIKKVVIPYREKYIREKMATLNLGTEKPFEWWLDLHLKREPLSTSLSLWLTENYSPNGSLFKATHSGMENTQALQDEIAKQFEKENTQRVKYNTPVGELEYLGLISIGIDGIGGWDHMTTMTWTLSDFAYEFIEFIENTPDQLNANVFMKY